MYFNEVAVSLSNRMRVQVDEAGRIALPSEVGTRLGLTEGAEFLLEETPHALTLRRVHVQPAKIYIEPTSRCNLACRMCIHNAWEEPQGTMSEAIFARLMEGIEALPEKPLIVFGGFGEPLFHPKIREMVRRAKAAASHVELITNGILFTEDLAREFIRLGVDRVWFSLDRLHADAYADGANPIQNIEKLNYLRYVHNASLPETGIVFVAARSNLSELPSLLRVASRYGISHYMMTNVLPYSAEMCEEALYTRALDAMESQPSMWSPSLQLLRMDWNEDTLMPLYQTLRARHNVQINGARLNPAEGRCPFIETGAVAVSWDGSVSPCLGLMHSHVSYLYDKPRAVSRYVVGNVNDAALSEIWNNADHLAFRQRVHEFDFSPCTLCGGCDMAEANLEDCFGNTFPTCGGCLWAWGVIQCP
ncbi:MAG: tungsten cofactor oxidoreductase radical SAM maturase [Anaerolineales bacterium]